VPQPSAPVATRHTRCNRACHVATRARRLQPSPLRCNPGVRPFGARPNESNALAEWAEMRAGLICSRTIRLPPSRRRPTCLRQRRCRADLAGSKQTHKPAERNQTDTQASRAGTTNTQASRARKQNHKFHFVRSHWAATSTRAAKSWQCGWGSVREGFAARGRYSPVRDHG
jgi:hypothetical protein